MIVGLDLIDPSPLNPRQRFDLAALEELASSIRVHGVIEPVVLRPAGERFQVLAGERRCRAARMAGLSDVPAVLREAPTHGEALAVMLAENLQRADLNPIEEAQAFARLKGLGLTQREIADRVGRSQPSIANAIRLLALPESVQLWIRRGRLSAAHGRALLRFSDSPALLLRVAELAVERKATTKALEAGVPFAATLRAEGLLPAPDAPQAPQEDPPLTEAQISALFARLPHRRGERAAYMSLVARALLPGARGPVAFPRRAPDAAEGEKSAPPPAESPWDAGRLEPLWEVGPIHFEVGPRAAPLRALALVLWALVTLYGLLT